MIKILPLLITNNGETWKEIYTPRHRQHWIDRAFLEVPPHGIGRWEEYVFSVGVLLPPTRRVSPLQVAPSPMGRVCGSREGPAVSWMWNSLHVEGNIRLGEEAFPPPAKYFGIYATGLQRKDAPTQE